MIKNLLKWFGPASADTIKSCPSIQGHLTVDLINRRGKVVRRSSGSNIWTLTGREYLSELIALETFSLNANTRTKFRDDRIAYIGLGTGSQPEVAEVASLVNPVSYDDGTANSGTYLALLDMPAIFPATSAATTKTAVQFIKEFGELDYSPVNSIVLTEAGLFTDGNPNNNWEIGTLDRSLAQSYTISPVAYKAFEPITKTSDYTMKIVWEVRFI